MHEADDAYSIQSTWSCYWLDPFLTRALNILILSIFYISMDLSTNYFAHFSGCSVSFVCSCHSILECCVMSQVEYKIVCFISSNLQCPFSYAVNEEFSHMFNCEFGPVCPASIRGLTLENPHNITDLQRLKCVGKFLMKYERMRTDLRVACIF